MGLVKMSENNKNENVKPSGEKISNFEKKETIIKSKKDRILTVVDRATGEVEAQIKLQDRKLGTGWFAMFQNPIGWIAEQRLSGEQLSVLLYLLSKMEYDNYLRVPQKTIAEKLNMTQSHVSRAMKLLKDMNIIVEEKREGTNKTYRFNPNIAHKGSYNYRDNVIEFNQKVDEKRRRRPKSNEDE